MATQPLVVLFEDPHILAVVKPAGLLTQRNLKGEPSLEEVVRAYLDPLSPGEVYLGTVHRLDRPVSGLILWAKTPKAAQRLAGQFGRREVSKEYVGICEDQRPGPGPIDLDWTNWLTPSSDPKGVVHVVEEATPGARFAKTRVSVEEGGPGTILRLRFHPITGRTHQLRVQAAVRGMPVVGDLTYGATRPFSPGIMLHAHMLRFQHPSLLSPIELTAPLPDSWANAEIVK